ncbi:unnamed protein product [Rhizoctonia solani]|uniref:Uncharacterized protein n=1 Tax=Rhizoctonia solani TaxID=456999 RepID=A0A8H2XMZ4_9AGAM|nr:unnamed protein product [Rhizoctonia solani]
METRAHTGRYLFFLFPPRIPCLFTICSTPESIQVVLELHMSTPTTIMKVKLSSLKFLDAAILATTSVTKLIDIPGFRQPVKTMRGIAFALQPVISQAPKHLSEQAQEQIDRIDEAIAFIGFSMETFSQRVRDSTDPRAGDLFAAQILIDKLEKLKVKLVKTKNKKYARRFLDQRGIFQDLDDHNQSFQQANQRLMLLLYSMSFNRAMDAQIPVTTTTEFEPWDLQERISDTKAIKVACGRHILPFINLKPFRLHVYWTPSILGRPVDRPTL